MPQRSVEMTGTAEETVDDFLFMFCTDVHMVPVSLHTVICSIACINILIRAALNPRIVQCFLS